MRVIAAVPAGGPEFPADLEGDVRFAGARGHGDQHAALAAEDCLNETVNGNALVVVRDLAGRKIEGREETLDGGRVGEVLLVAPPGPEILRGGEIRKLAFLACGEIELDDGVAVGGVGEGQAEDGGVVLGSLQALGRVFVGGLGLDHRERQVASVAEKVVGALARASSGSRAL